jgi:hypothetical protein
VPPALPPYVSERDESTLVGVRVQARAGRDEIAGRRGDLLLVKVTAPPVGGEANRALCKLLARRVGIPIRWAAVIRGETARTKLVELLGVRAAEVAARLETAGD